MPPLTANLVVTCAKRKRRPPASALWVRKLPAGGPIGRRAAAWVRRLEAAGPTVATAADTYCGDSWAVVLAAARVPGVRVWVCSAGYGLIALTDHIHPYAATFAPGHEDSVRRFRGPDGGAACVMAWWAALAEWPGPTPGGPRSIADLAAAFPDAPLVAALSAPYLQAVTADLATAGRRLRHPDLLSVVCAGVRPDGHPLARHLIPCDARWQPAVGGALASLNVRLAARALGEVGPGDLTVPVLRRRFAGWLSTTNRRPRPTRAPMTDGAIRRAVRQALVADPTARPTALLRLLRDQGRACEQTRLARLFREVRGDAHARPV